MKIEESTTKQSFKQVVSLCSKIIETGTKTMCPGPGYPKARKYILEKMNKGFITFNATIPSERTEIEQVHVDIGTKFYVIAAKNLRKGLLSVEQYGQF